MRWRKVSRFNPELNTVRRAFALRTSVALLRVGYTAGGR